MCVLQRRLKTIVLLIVFLKVKSGVAVTERIAQYSIVSTDNIFRGERISVVKVKSLIHCANSCVFTDGCNGFNYLIRRPATEDVLTTCETVRLPNHPSDGSLLPNTGWSAYTLQWKSVVPSDLSLSTKITATDMVTSLGGATATTTTTEVIFVDKNPQYCSVNGAFVYNSQLFLVSGDALYTYDDVSDLGSGPVKTQALSFVLPGTTPPIDAVFTDGAQNNLHIIKDGTVITFTNPSERFQWKASDSGKSTDSFFGQSYSAITGVCQQNEKIIILIGKKGTLAGTSDQQFLKATNNGMAPKDTSAAATLNADSILIFNDNDVYKFNKGGSDSRGTWISLGAVKCRK